MNRILKLKKITYMSSDIQFKSDADVKSSIEINQIRGFTQLDMKNTWNNLFPSNKHLQCIGTSPSLDIYLRQMQFYLERNLRTCKNQVANFLINFLILLPFEMLTVNLLLKITVIYFSNCLINAIWFHVNALNSWKATCN